MSQAPNDSRKDSYNKFSSIDSISYNCIKYLLDNDEESWKLMYYSDPDCWKRDNLTTEQKASLVYSGQPNETDFRVFSDVGADNAWTVEACILRISPNVGIPNNYVWGTISIGFEIYSNYKINHTSCYKTRIDMMTQRMIEVFNGSDIPDLGRIFFDQRASHYCKMLTIGAIPYKGRAIIMCVNSLG